MNKVFISITLMFLIILTPFVPPTVNFIGHYRDIKSLVVSVDPEESPLPQPIKGLLLFSLNDDTASYSARLLNQQFYHQSFAGHTWSWHIINMTWSFLIRLNTSEQERLALIAHLAPTGGGRVGLNNTSQAIFGVPLSKISVIQAATLVELTKAPSLFYNNEQYLLVRRDELLARYQDKIN